MHHEHGRVTEARRKRWDCQKINANLSLFLPPNARWKRSNKVRSTIAQAVMDSPNEAKNAMRFNNLSHEVRGSCRWTHFFRACERFSLAAFPGARSLPLKRPSWIAVGMPRLFDFEQRALPCRKGALHDLLKTI
jgi:hypothetical protein